MKKEEVELILIKATVDGHEAVNIKIYKNGTTCRSGAGGIPQIGISGMSFIDDTRYFMPLLKKVPQELLDQPINYEEETPNGYLEYIVAFYGLTKNGETGEHADWSKSTGIRVKIDNKTSFKHQILSFCDSIAMEALELTNEWYFDVIMNVKWNSKSSSLPDQTIISHPKTEQEIHQDYENYINQMNFGAQKGDMSEYVKGKTYEKNGIYHNATIKISENNFNIKFTPIKTIVNRSSPKTNVHTNKKATKKKPWWNFFQPKN